MKLVDFYSVIARPPTTPSLVCINSICPPQADGRTDGTGRTPPLPPVKSGCGGGGGSITTTTTTNSGVTRIASTSTGSGSGFGSVYVCVCVSIHSGVSSTK